MCIVYNRLRYLVAIVIAAGEFREMIMITPITKRNCFPLFSDFSKTDFGLSHEKENSIKSNQAFLAHGETWLAESLIQ